LKDEHSGDLARARRKVCTIVHAHSRRHQGVRARRVRADRRGVFASDEVLKLMADRGVYFDPQVCLVFRNYLDNHER
jgi:hypothetical protein